MIKLQVNRDVRADFMARQEYSVNWIESRKVMAKSITHHTCLVNEFLSNVVDEHATRLQCAVLRIDTAWGNFHTARQWFMHLPTQDG